MRELDVHLVDKGGAGYILVSFTFLHFRFVRDLRSLNNDAEVLQFVKDMNGHELVDLY